MSILALYLINSVYVEHAITDPILFACWFGGVILAIIAGMCIADGTEEEKRALRHVGKWYAIFSIIVALLNLATIDREDAAWIAGGYVVTNTEGVSELPENVVNAANAFLKSISGDEANEAAD